MIVCRNRLRCTNDKVGEIMIVLPIGAVCLHNIVQGSMIYAAFLTHPSDAPSYCYRKDYGLCLHL
jgi:zinc transporter ZupT